MFCFYWSVLFYLNPNWSITLGTLNFQRDLEHCKIVSDFITLLGPSTSDQDILATVEDDKASQSGLTFLISLMHRLFLRYYMWAGTRTDDVHLAQFHSSMLQQIIITL